MPTHYDDGGYSGGDIERPALQRLLEDIQAGKVDCVVIYKLDRLSRSLLDFARIMELFDKHNVSFVAVTQQVNSATSMVRLMLNILLSFAQFEREIIGERIRDKIAAQRRKGKWAGGIPVLGYDVDRTGPSPKLVVNVTEAARVRQMFDLYRQLGSLLSVVRELDNRGWQNKEWVTKKGHRRGGRPFDKSSLHALLTNPIYRGQIKHKDDLYEGEHEPLITKEIFDAVQTQLQSKHRGEVRNQHNALLSGRLFCKACQRAMVHSFTSKSTTRYRYYLCSNANKNGRSACPSPTLRAAEIESVVLEQIRVLADNDSVRRQILKQVQAQAQAERQGWHDQRRGLEKELARHRAALKQVAVQGPPTEATAALMEYLHERIAEAKARIAELDEQLADADDAWKQEDVADAMEDFDVVWNTLSPREQHDLVGLLVSRIDFDPDDCSLTLEFHSTGIKDIDRGLGGAA